MIDLKRTAAFVLLGLLLSVPGFGPRTLAAQTACTFNPSFQALRDLIPDVVGDCTESEQLNAGTGLVEQRTSGGLLMLRPADGLTGFTDGTTLWLMGPDGLVSRAMTDPQFAWEAIPSGGDPAANGSAPDDIATGPTADTDSTADPAAAPVQAAGSPRIGRIYWSTNSDVGQRAANHQDVIKCCAAFYVFYDYYDLTAPNRLRQRQGQNGEFFGVGGTDFTPRLPTGTIRIGPITPGPRFNGTWLLAVYLNGQEVARSTVRIE